MKNKIIVSWLIFTVFSLSFCVSNSVEARSKKHLKEIYSTNISPEDINTQLKPIINEPYDVQVNNNNITINIHKIILTTDSYFKNKLYSISSYLASVNKMPDVLVTAWKGLDSNYEYKAAVVKDDLNDYNKGIIDYNTLFSRIKIVKSEIKRENDTLESNLEEPARIYLSSQDKLVKSPIPDERPNLKPQIPPESFYTPILKPIIKEAFAVTSESNFVTINIYAKPDEDDNLLKDKAYEIMRRIMGVNPSLGKIVINWQPEQGGFGKSASLAGIYIKDFFSKKITRNELKEVIFTAAIEPESRHLNEVMDIAKVEVPIDNLRKGKELRTAANIYRQNKKYDSAIRTYEQAIQFNPNDFLSYYWIGEVYAELKEFDKAKVSLSKALGLNPDFRQADESLARIKSGDCNK